MTAGDPLGDFVQGYIYFIADEEAQRLAWERYPCSEWLEDMIEAWEMVRSKGVKPFAHIDPFIEGIEDFLNGELGDLLERTGGGMPYVQSIQGHADWVKIVRQAKNLLAVLPVPKQPSGW